jgi:hypothetical protein
MLRGFSRRALRRGPGRPGLGLGLACPILGRPIAFFRQQFSGVHFADNYFAIKIDTANLVLRLYTSLPEPIEIFLASPKPRNSKP